MAHGEQSDLIIKVDKTFNDDAPGTATATRLRIIPSVL